VPPRAAWIAGDESGVKPASQTREVQIRNRLGLHARAAAQFVKTAGRFRAEISVEVGRQRVNGKSIMGLLMLAAAQGTLLRLRAIGEDGPVALQALSDLVESRFGERE
jgi:phosphocarrier protein HPr